jgi:hypothetical protein
MQAISTYAFPHPPSNPLLLFSLADSIACESQHPSDSFDNHLFYAAPGRATNWYEHPIELSFGFGGKLL